MSKKIMKTGIELNQLLNSLNKLCPLYLAESWDNVGLLVRPTKVDKVYNLLLTNDLTEKVLKEAIDLKVNFIFTYHPNIFSPLKSVNYLNSWKERIVVESIENQIAIYSPHTALDSIENGVNDWIVSSFNYKSKSPIDLKKTEDGKTLLENVGIGRQVELSEPLTVNQIIEISKKHFGLSHLRLALAVDHNQDTRIQSIAVCAGSGGSVLRNVKSELLITGEMSHHETLDFNHKGISVILTEHSNCERGYLKVFANILEKEIGENKLNFIVSQIDEDPLKVV